MEVTNTVKLFIPFILTTLVTYWILISNCINLLTVILFHNLCTLFIGFIFNYWIPSIPSIPSKF